MAQQGDASAQYNLGHLYANGQWVSLDLERALQWWWRAAAQGLVAVQRNLGLYVPDSGQAAQWSHLAAEQGDAVAQRNLGVMYATGEGVPQDFIQAHLWLNLAVARMSSEPIVLLVLHFYPSRQ